MDIPTELTPDNILLWINSGKPCVYRFGRVERQGLARPLTKEQALMILPNYSPTSVFHRLSFTTYNDSIALQFCETAPSHYY